MREASAEGGESLGTEQELTNHEERPTLPDGVHRPGRTAEILIISNSHEKRLP
jgi:hypothetical protein